MSIKALHLTAVPLRSTAACELGRFLNVLFCGIVAVRWSSV